MRCFLVLLIVFYLPLASASESLLFAVVPQQSAKVLAKKWTPLLNYLEMATGLDIRFVTAKNIPTFEHRLARQVYDIAYMNPYHYVHYHEQSGYQVFAKQRGKQIQGIVVVRRDSGISSLHQLAGERIAFPSPAAFAASIIPRATMAAMGLGVEPSYVSSHDSVYLNVSKGFFPAGGGIVRTFELMPGAVKQDLQIIWTSPGYTPHAIAHRLGLDKAKVDKIQAALLSLNDKQAYSQVLKSIQFSGFELAHDSMWDDVRALNIGTMGIDKPLGQAVRVKQR